MRFLIEKIEANLNFPRLKSEFNEFEKNDVIV